MTPLLPTATPEIAKNSEEAEVEALEEELALSNLQEAEAELPTAVATEKISSAVPMMKMTTTLRKRQT